MTISPSYAPLNLKLTRVIEGWVMRSATAITSTGSKVVDLLAYRQPLVAKKAFVIRNGYDAAFQDAAQLTGGRLAILFAGELYLNRDPFPLLDAVERLFSRPDIDPHQVTVTFMGRKTQGTSDALARWLVGKRCAPAVRILPPQAASVVEAASINSTVLLNLAQQQPLSIPAKTFEHLASGRENLLLCEDDSESAQLVAKIPGVIQVDPRNTEALDGALLDLYERHVNQGLLRAPAQQDVLIYSRDASNAQFFQLISSLLESRKPPKDPRS